MEKENKTGLNSPLIQRNTPIKRLGLSRKRKSRSPGSNINPKIQPNSGNSPINNDSLEESPSVKEIVTDPKDSDNGVTDPEINYDKEIDLLSSRIVGGEENYKALQHMKDNIVQLEQLIEVWKKGCKSAFLHFSELLKNKQEENIDFKSVLKRLGIWEVMVENFGSDPELCLMDYNQ